MQPYKNSIATLLPDKKPVLIAVSGGLDSVVLTDLSQKTGLDFAVAHCNFQLRGEESERDEKFVRQLAEKYGRKCYIRKFETGKISTENKWSIQETARKIRYEWFNQLAKEEGYMHVLTAHHADDNIETMLMHFFRGTGLKGLTGIPPSSGIVLRPMLSFRKQDLENYAKENSLAWVEDSSNANSDYTRNLFRNEIIPLIRKAYPEAEENLLRNIDRFNAIFKTYQQYISGVRSGLLETSSSGEVLMPVKKLMRYAHTSIPYELFSAYEFSEGQVKEIMSLADSQTGKYVSNGKWQVIRHRNMLVIAYMAEESGMIAIEKDEKLRTFSGGELKFDLVNAKDHKLLTDPNVAQLDASFINWPLILRKWKPGDYFYPLGLRKKKKLARFFIDQKLSKAQKENAWVIESDQRIVWITGMRIDDRAKITPKTKQVLLIRYIPK